MLLLRVKHNVPKPPATLLRPSLQQCTARLLRFAIRPPLHSLLLCHRMSGLSLVSRLKALLTCRPALPLGKAASLTRAMSITRAGSGRRLTANGAGMAGDCLAATLAAPPPLSPAVAAAAAVAHAHSGGASGSQSGSQQGRRKKLGRPIAFQGDVNSPELTEAERRHIRR